MNNKKIIINIGREVGSGGHIIGQKLAERFNIPLHDREILNLAAKESGFSEELFEENDEDKGFFKSITNFRGFSLNSGGFYNNGLTQESLFQFQSDAIVLRDYDNVVNIFITATLEDRIQSVMKRNNCDAETAEKIIEKKEEKRASFYAFYTGKKWGHSTSYDLCISSSILGLDKTTDFIADFVCKALEINE